MRVSLGLGRGRKQELVCVEPASCFVSASRGDTLSCAPGTARKGTQTSPENFRRARFSVCHHSPVGSATSLPSHRSHGDAPQVRGPGRACFQRGSLPLEGQLWRQSPSP